MNIREIILRLPEEILQEVDVKAKCEERSRNNFLNRMIKKALEEYDEKQ